ncbi:MAG TPA: UDP-N-acetylmuramoyl-L-alanyl-D-glutamate--2,6-diaminopimelate ligase [Dissulfurispiraceae bacterium]|nr:UDP-N-acetylmuramoyl-L-alanyl-D-glutamate--2,6-diaminopimelate ligase [Dissulfurispiraceae bacterium]
MNLATLIKDYKCTPTGPQEQLISGITYDSRQVASGSLFVAIRGEKSDGHDFVDRAIVKGARAIVYEKSHPSASELIGHYPNISWIGVDDCRDSLAAISDKFFRHPSKEICVVGITGTNGKTTTSYLIKSVLEKWSKSVGLIGTINYMIKNDSFEAPHTTPEASDFQSLLRQMVDKGCSHVVAEVSSHALAQKRADHTQFKVAVFTNLTGDHLDYHGTMEDYFKAKMRLFTELLIDGGAAIINIDDPYGKLLSDHLKNVRPSIKLLTFSLSNKEADFVAEEIIAGFRGTSFLIRAKNSLSSIPVRSPLVGRTGIYNILSAASAAMALGVPVEVISEGIAAVDIVRGRFERVDLGQAFLAIIDYAHTHDALERLLETSQQLLEACSITDKQKELSGKVITVFGCGGNRDKSKRPKMGRIASNLSDFVIVTSDNPRNEEPMGIIRDIEAGIEKDNYIVIPDRHTAIRMAALLASPGDIVIIAGKGHEDYQEIKDVRYPFSDRTVLEDAVKETFAISIRGRRRRRLKGKPRC